MELSIDGTAIPPTQLGVVNEASTVIELQELRRRLERKEIDIKKKDKDILGYQKEISRLNKALKNSEGELVNLRDRNEQLQQNLMVARMQSQRSKEENEVKQLQTRVKDLEAAIGTVTHRYTMSESELEASRKTVNALEERIHEIREECDLLRSNAERSQADAKSASEQLSRANGLCTEKEGAIADMSTEILRLMKSNSHIQQQVNALIADKESLNGIISNYKREVSKLKDMLVMRSEANEALQRQIDELSSNKIFLQKSEIDHLKTFEVDNARLQDRIKDIANSLDIQLDLLRRTEIEKKTMSDTIEGLRNKEAALTKEIIELKQSVAEEISHLKTARRENAQLETELAKYKELLDEQGLGAQREMQMIRADLTQTAKQKQAEADAKSLEIRRRKAAEDNARFLKAKVAFLLEQLRTAAEASLSWQDERQVLLTKISSLYSANLIIRKRLTQYSQSEEDKQLEELLEENMASQMKTDAVFLTEASSAGLDQDALQEKTLIGIAAAAGGGGTDFLNQELSNPSQMIERSLFDCICAFGAAQKRKSSSTKKKHREKAKFRGKLSEDGLQIEIISGEGEVQALELLQGLQLPSFLKFAQSRGEEKLPLLLTEKLASILNQFSSLFGQLSEQLSAYRVKMGSLQARSSTSVARSNKLSKKYADEREAKQNIILSFVKERLHSFDMSSELGRALIGTLGDESTQSNGVLISSGRLMEGIAELKERFLEMRLADIQLDDDVLSSVVDLLDCVSTGNNCFAHAMQPNLGYLIGKVCVFDLKNNNLTDISCKTLCPLIEQSAVLRLLDLRENAISSSGLKIVFDGIRRNQSVMYVTNKQNGAMIEGFRELASGAKVDPSINPPNHSMRIDLRYNNPSKATVSDCFDQFAMKETVREQVQSTGNVKLKTKLKARLGENTLQLDKTLDIFSTGHKSQRDPERPPLAGIRGILQSRAAKGGGENDATTQDLSARMRFTEVMSGDTTHLGATKRHPQRTTLKRCSSASPMGRDSTKLDTAREEKKSKDDSKIGMTVRERTMRVTRAVYQNKVPIAFKGKTIAFSQSRAVDTLGVNDMSGMIDATTQSRPIPTISVPLSLYQPTLKIKKHTPSLKDRLKHSVSSDKAVAAAAGEKGKGSKQSAPVAGAGTATTTRPSSSGKTRPKPQTQDIFELLSSQRGANAALF